MREGLELLHDLGVRLFPLFVDRRGALPLFMVPVKPEEVDAALATLDSQLAEANRSGQHWFINRAVSNPTFRLTRRIEYDSPIV
jgi:hypothetical protein